ncbi:MAG: aminoacyl-tRNA hydrolase, partial [Patescibacteria group bacterium]
MKLIVGLGNPGKEYEDTRHNAGFLAIDLLAGSLPWTNDKAHKALITKAKTPHGETVMLAKPQTFMNLSGDAVQGLVSYYKVAPAELLIVQDELDLEPGMLAFLGKGGDAGHNGIASIQERMARSDIARLRIGVGRPVPPIKTEDWVLGKMDPQTHETIKRAPAAMKSWVEEGLAKA